MTSEATRHVMQGNKGANTKPELLLRSRLRSAGYPGYRLHWKGLPGRPDICYPGRRVAIFVNGCFWHRCPTCNLQRPRTNSAFWEAKFSRNVERDRDNWRDLVAQGWCVVVVWEHRLKPALVESTVEQVVLQLTAAEDGPHLGRVVEVGRASAWQLACRRKRLARHRRVR